jgi:hypothetical protein
MYKLQGAGFSPPRRCQMHVPRKFALLEKRRSSRASSRLTATGGGLPKWNQSNKEIDSLSTLK